MDQIEKSSIVSPQWPIGGYYRAPDFDGRPINPRLGSPEAVAQFPIISRPLLAWIQATHIFDTMGRYPGPDVARLEREISKHHGVSPKSVIVTCGADGALGGLIKQYTRPGKNMVTMTPCFGSVTSNAKFARGEVKAIRWWNEEFPLAKVLESIDDNTYLVLLTTPNNPTGKIIPLDAIKAVRDVKPDVVLAIDAVYARSANHDITPELLKLENTAVIRSFSKEGAAGLRVGYVVSSNEDIIEAMRSILDPYAVAAPSAHIAEAIMTRPSLQLAIDQSITKNIENRERLQAGMELLGIDHIKSQGNFVTVQLKSPEMADFVFDLLAGAGVGARDFKYAKDNEHRSSLRLGVPVEAPFVERLLKILEACKRPECILIDADAVKAGAITEAQKQELRQEGYRLVTVTRENRPAGLFRFLSRNPGNVFSADEGNITGNNLQDVMKKMGVTSAWYLGATADDVQGARAISDQTHGQRVVIPFGFSQSGRDPETLKLGTARIVGPNEFVKAVRGFPPFEVTGSLSGPDLKPRGRKPALNCV